MVERIGSGEPENPEDENGPWRTDEDAKDELFDDLFAPPERPPTIGEHDIDPATVHRLSIHTVIDE